MFSQVNHNGAMKGRCNQPMREDFCCLTEGHRGRHSSVGFPCDGCGQVRRSYPHATDPDLGQFCFMCSAEQVINPHGMPYEYY